MDYICLMSIYSSIKSASFMALSMIALYISLSLSAKLTELMWLFEQKLSESAINNTDKIAKN